MKTQTLNPEEHLLVIGNWSFIGYWDLVIGDSLEISN